MNRVCRLSVRLAGPVVLLLGSAVPIAASPPVAPTAVEWVDMESTPRGDGYWLVLETGKVEAFGGARHHGDASEVGALRDGVVGIAARPDGGGYWLAASDGGVFSFGNAPFHGSAADLPLVAPVVAIAGTSTGNGYWLLGADGGVFAFGDAPFLGRPAAGGSKAVGLAAAGSGTGYFVVHGNGGPAPFGDADSPEAVQASGGELFRDVASTRTGKGAWLVLISGEVSRHGDASEYGGAGAIPLQGSITAITATPSGHGYWLLGKDGGVFTFGDAKFHGRP